MNDNREERAAYLDAFLRTLEQLAEVAGRLTDAENAKAQAASAGEHNKMDSFLREEQALLLKLRGLEQVRERQAAALGFQNLTFRQLLKEAKPDEAAALMPLFTRLEQQLKDLTDARESAGRIVTSRLREFERLLGTENLDALPGADVPSHFHDRYV